MFHVESSHTEINSVNPSNFLLFILSYFAVYSGICYRPFSVVWVCLCVFVRYLFEGNDV